MTIHIEGVNFVPIMHEELLNKGNYVSINGEHPKTGTIMLWDTIVLNEEELNNANYLLTKESLLKCAKDQIKILKETGGCLDFY